MPARPLQLVLRARLAAVFACLALGAGAGPALADDAAPSAPLQPAPAAVPDAVVPAPAAAPDAVAPAPPFVPQVSYVETESDLVAPLIALGKTRHRLEAARRKGLRLPYTVVEPVELRADLMILGEVSDRELRMSELPAAGPGVSLAKATVTRAQPGKSAVRLHFNRAARRTLRHFFKLTTLLRVIVTDAAGNETVAYRRVTLSNL